MPTAGDYSRIADPAINPGDGPYFEAAGEGRLMLRCCRACGEHHHFPRAICPFCWSQELDWVEASGRGTIYTFSVTRRGERAPYCIAYVQLEEGPLMMTNIVAADLDEVRIGMRVAAIFPKSEGGLGVPMFSPVESDSPAE
jgi:uncharacterized OB-fold protein